MVVEGAPLGRLVHEGDSDGWRVEPIETPPVYSLCRCGGSRSMPFCDQLPGRDCFEEGLGDGPDPRPFRWDVPDPAGAPALGLKPNGPVRVAGDVAITYGGRALDSDGRVSLCRCGASRCQPLCDSSHKTSGFVG